MNILTKVINIMDDNLQGVQIDCASGMGLLQE